MMLALLVLVVMSTGVAIEKLEKLLRLKKMKSAFGVMALMGMTYMLPELFVAVFSGLYKFPELSLGMVMGVNIASLSLVVGVAAIFAGSVAVVGDFMRRELWISLGIAVFPFLLMSDGNLSQFDGALLILVYLLYLKLVVRGEARGLKMAKLEKHIVAKHHHQKWTNKFRDWLGLAASILVLFWASGTMVNLSLEISKLYGLSGFWLGVVFVGLGVALPSVLFGVEEIMEKKAILMLENLFGGVVTSSSLVLGVLALVGKVSYTDSVQHGLSGIFLVIAMTVVWLFTMTKKRLDNWEGVILVAVYCLFVALQLMFAWV